MMKPEHVILFIEARIEEYNKHYLRDMDKRTSMINEFNALPWYIRIISCNPGDGYWSYFDIPTYQLQLNYILLEAKYALITEQSYMKLDSELARIFYRWANENSQLFVPQVGSNFHPKQTDVKYSYSVFVE